MERRFELRNLFFLFSSIAAICGCLITVRRRYPGWILLTACAFVYPLIYYITETYPRYRQVVEPELALLVAVGVSAALKTVKIGLKRVNLV